MLLVCLQQVNVKKSRKLMKTVNVDEENLHIFRTNGENSMKFSRKTCLMIILKVTKKILKKMQFRKNHR